MTTRNSNVAIDIYEAARRSALVKRALNGPLADSAGVKPLQPPEPPAPLPAAQQAAPPVAPQSSTPPATAPIATAPAAAPLTPPPGQPVGSMPPAAGQPPAAPTAPTAPPPPPAPTAPAPAAPSPPPKPAQPAAAQNQPQQPAATAPEPAPKMPLTLPENTPPERAAQIEGAYTQLAQLDKLNPNAWQLGREALQDPKSEAAQTVTANAQQVYTDPANHADKPPPDPQGWAGWLSQKQDEFQALPFPAQLAMGLGLGVGVVGLMSSLLGEGGMGSFLMSALGLGAAGAIGAGSGLFGQGAQNTMADVIGRVGQATGMVPKQLTPEQRAILTAKDPIAAVMSMSGGAVTPAAAAQKVQQAREAFKQLQMLHGLGGMGGRILQHTGLSPEEAAQAENNIPTLLRAYNDPNSELSKRLQLGEQYGALPERLNNAASTAWQAAANKIQDARNWFRRPTTDLRKKGSSMNIAQQIWLQQQTIKAARCWAGYEPVPGKAPYSEDSCRPKGSKKTQKKTTEKKSGEKSAAQPYTGETSKTPFDAQHAIQTLGLNPKTSPQVAYNRMMYMHRNNKFTPQQFSAFRNTYQGLPPTAPAATPPQQTAQPAPAPGAPARTPAQQTARPGLRTQVAMPPKSAAAPAAKLPAPKMPQDWVDSFKKRVQGANKAMGQLTGKKAEEECCATGTLPKHDAGEPTKQVTPKKVETDHAETVVTGGLEQKKQPAA